MMRRVGSIAIVLGVLVAGGAAARGPQGFAPAFKQRGDHAGPGDRHRHGGPHGWGDRDPGRGANRNVPGGPTFNHQFEFSFSGSLGGTRPPALVPGPGSPPGFSGYTGRMPFSVAGRMPPRVAQVPGTAPGVPAGMPFATSFVPPARTGSLGSSFVFR